MTTYIFPFGHGYSSKDVYDPGTQCFRDGKWLSEAVYVRMLRPHMEKALTSLGVSYEFVDRNLYADRSISQYQGRDVVVTEIHLDGPKGSGGHVIINAKYEPDETDNRMRDVIQKWWGIVGYLQASEGISKRADLFNCNVAASNGINYRLLELFFLSNDEHRKIFENNLEEIAIDLVEAATGRKVIRVTEERPNTVASEPDELGRSTRFKRGELVRLRPQATFTPEGREISEWARQQELVVDWLNEEGTVSIKLAADTGAVAFFTEKVYDWDIYKV